MDALLFKTIRPLLAASFGLLPLLCACESIPPSAAGLDAALLPAASSVEQLRSVAASRGDPACPAINPVLPASTGSLYYASPRGQGGGSSLEDPAELATLLNRLDPGDTVEALPGDYGTLDWPAEKSGTPAAPITLRAHHPAVAISGTAPGLEAKAVADQQRTRLSLKMNGISNVRIDGIHGRIEVEDASQIELLRNHHLENEVVNMQLFAAEGVSVHHSLFENYRLKPGSAEDWHTDYGIAAYQQARLAVHHNVFSGGFNHAISLKERNYDVTIACNRFTNCGRHCLELGQQTDGRPPSGSPVDRTSARVLVENNLIEKTEDRLVNADFAVMVMNADEVGLLKNRFAGFDQALLVSSYWAPSNCRDQGETMSQIGITPSLVRLRDNQFDGPASLRITGRGSVNDQVEVSGMSGGPFSCAVRPLAPITCDDACCRWDPAPASEAPPKIASLDGSLACVPETP